MTRRMSSTWLAWWWVVAACGDEVSAPADSGSSAETGEPDAAVSTDAEVPTRSDAATVADADVVSETFADASEDSPEVCALGESRACDCSSGARGHQTCVDVSGVYSACGCATPGGSQVLVPPPEPVEMICGGNLCDPYLEEDTEVGAKHCCIDDEVCGSASKFVFGEGSCVPRGGDPGTPDARCPDESPNFLDLVGCCRPDGMCGLSLDANNNFDLGCIERTEMDRLLESDADRRYLSDLFSLEHDNGDFDPIPCE